MKRWIKMRNKLNLSVKDLGPSELHHVYQNSRVYSVHSPDTSSLTHQQKSIMTSSSYYGSRISLISNKNIRYEGTLTSVDPNHQLVRLANGLKSYFFYFLLSNPLVQSHGTEGRDSFPFIPPSSDIYEYIIFRGSDIKELQMPAQPPQPKRPSVDDPAILDSSVCLLSFKSDLFLS